MGATQNTFAISTQEAARRKVTVGLAPPRLTPSFRLKSSERCLPLPELRPEPALPATHRCGEKGCVFPVAPGTMGRCLHHDRQRHEPVLYQSRQPTSLVLEQAKFGLEVTEFDHSRGIDRRRLAFEREVFLED